MPRVLPSMSKGGLLLSCSGPFHLDSTLVPPSEELVAEVLGEAGFDDIATETEDESTVGMRYGNAFHELMAARLKGGIFSLSTLVDATAEKYTCDPIELGEHVEQSVVTLQSWMSGENPYGIDFRPRTYDVELPLAVSLQSKSVRICAPTDPATHVYPDVDYSTELPGTADLLVRPFKGAGALPKFGPSPNTAARAAGFNSWARVPSQDRRAIKNYANYVLILDHKTGAHVAPPHELPQLWALALAGVRLYRARGAILATLHAPRGGAPTVYCSPTVIDADKLDRFEKNLRRAHSRIGDGSIRPGPHCMELFCPRFDDCEIHRPALLQLGLGPQPPEHKWLLPPAGAPLRPENFQPTREMRTYLAENPSSFDLDLSQATPGAVARIAAGLTEFGRLSKALKEPLRERIKELNEAGETIRALGQPGKRVDVGVVKKRSLSMKSVTDALGKVDGAKELDRLAKLGCIKDVEYERVQLKNDD